MSVINRVKEFAKTMATLEPDHENVEESPTTTLSKSASTTDILTTITTTAITACSCVILTSTTTSTTSVAASFVAETFSPLEATSSIATYSSGKESSSPSNSVSSTSSAVTATSTNSSSVVSSTTSTSTIVLAKASSGFIETPPPTATLSSPITTDMRNRSDLEEENLGLKAKVKESESYLARVIQKLADSDKTCLELQTQAEKDRQTISKLKDKAKIKENQARQLQSEIEKINEENRDKTQLKAEINQALSNLGKSQKEVGHLTQKIEQLQQDLLESRRVAIEEVSQKQKQIQELNGKLSHAQQEIAALTEQLQTEMSEKQTSKQLAIQDVQSKYVDVQAELIRAENELNSKCDELLGVQRFIQQQDNELAELKDTHREAVEEKRKFMVQHNYEVTMLKEDHTRQLSQFQQEQEATIQLVRKELEEEWKRKIAKYEKELRALKEALKEKDAQLGALSEQAVRAEEKAATATRLQRRMEDRKSLISGKGASNRYGGSSVSSSGGGGMTMTSSSAVSPVSPSYPVEDEQSKRNEYLKQLFLKFCCTNDRSIRIKLFSVISTLLQFTPTEIQSVYRSNSEYDPNRPTPLTTVSNVINLLLGSPTPYS